MPWRSRKPSAALTRRSEKLPSTEKRREDEKPWSPLAMKKEEEGEVEVHCGQLRNTGTSTATKIRLLANPSTSTSTGIRTKTPHTIAIKREKGRKQGIAA